VLVDFLYELRRAGVPVSSHEWLALMEGLGKGLHDSSLDGFYRLARALCVKDVAHLDAFDVAFLAYFKDVRAASLDLASQLDEWLKGAIERRELSDDERRMLEALDPAALRALFEQRLREQTERHDGGSRWIGTGGTSPFGHGGQHPTGMRVGGAGGMRSAMQIAGERQFRDYRSDLVLDVRQIDLALRRLRQLGREGAEEELDLDDTVAATSRNAGDLELVFHPPKRNRLKLILLMDVGGSMDPHARLVERLFTAASRAGRFASFRALYFHNCVYRSVWEDAGFTRAVPVPDLIHRSSRDERLVIVGDGLMHPAELMQAGGAIYYDDRQPTAGIAWLRRLAEHYRRAVWLNPEPPRLWPRSTIEVIAGVFPMWQLTLDGLGEAVRYLVRGGPRPGPAGVAR
jgi:uncharacterized protein with von Willebrand factor type A (vWA) domain